MKILTVVGARPQFVKAAALTRLIQETEGVEEVLVHTGQHYDPLMSDIFFKELQIPTPKYQLGVGSLSPTLQTAKIMEKLEPVLNTEKPDWVLIYGDTNSTLAGALTAAKSGFRVAHVEAGLRSFNLAMPEEINRKVADQLSEVLFTPTQGATDQLLKEGFSKEKIFQVGDIMWDALLYSEAQADKTSTVLHILGLKEKGYILSTIHRQSNTDTPELLENILLALNEVAKEIPVVLPLHPRTKSKMPTAFVPSLNLKIIEPVGYLDMLKLEKHAALIATDSGGIQKEAFFFKVACVTLRNETEWQELLDLGWNRLASPENTKEMVQTILSNLNSSGKEASPYGNGNTAKEILTCLQRR